MAPGSPSFAYRRPLPIRTDAKKSPARGRGANDEYDRLDLGRIVDDDRSVTHRFAVRIENDFVAILSQS